MSSASAAYRVECVFVRNRSATFPPVFRQPYESPSKARAYHIEPYSETAAWCLCPACRYQHRMLRSKTLAKHTGTTTAAVPVELASLRQHVRDAKTVGSHGHLSIDSEMLEVLKLWKPVTQFPSDGTGVFASPFKPALMKRLLECALLLRPLRRGCDLCRRMGLIWLAKTRNRYTIAFVF
jgi:hypothetical protein